MEEAQSNNIQKNSIKRYKGSSIRTSQNTLQDNPDWISRLPDSLLLHILSKLIIEEVVKTSLLSKRWRYLWMSIPCLDFKYLVTGRKFEKTTFIDRFLFHHDESKIDELRIQIEYEEKHAHLVDSWILFAVRHGVEELVLDLLDGKSPEDISSDYSNYTVYKLPHSLFRCGSLTWLELCGCDINLPTTIQLNSLEVLYLKYIDLDPFAIEHITTNCPLLKYLYLTSCNESIDLNICIPNDNIRNLKISEDGDHGFDNGITTINAPNLISLELCGRLPRADYHFQNLISLENVYFGHSYMNDVLFREDTVYDLTQLLHDLRHVKDFMFTSWCIQALATKGIWGLDPVSINATCIQIESGLTKWELPGIAYLLKSASYLERLEISWELFRPEFVLDLSDEFLEEYDFEEKDFWKLRELDSSSILQNTKTIEIRDFYSTIHVKDVKDWEKETEFVRFLLKTSKVLERMTIETCISSRNNTDLMLEVTRKLLSFPRASPNARLFIT